MKVLEAKAGGPYSSQMDTMTRFPQKTSQKQKLDDQKKSKDDPEWEFFDTARINAKGGDGGNGCVAFRREKGVPFGGPSGGNGGNGGSIFLKCNSKLNTLSMLRQKVHYKAGFGKPGMGKSLFGASAEDIYLEVPPGTMVRDENGKFAGELLYHDETFKIASGGQGGKGNKAFKSMRNTAPTICEKGEPGKERWIHIELKLVADLGFIGVPNAGKSTLLRATSNAKPKIANYPFTTLVPNLGVCDLIDPLEGGKNGAGGLKGRGLVLADIPGLLEGAHEGVGMGVGFLRHVSRCRALIHIIDASSKDPIGDFKAINTELKLFNPILANKPQVVVVNKIDLPNVDYQIIVENLRKVTNHSRILAISALSGKNCRELMHRCSKFIAPLFELKDDEKEVVTVNFDGSDEELSLVGARGIKFDIISEPKTDQPRQYRIVCPRLEKMVVMTNWEYEESEYRLLRVLKDTGIADALLEKGAVEQDIIMIGEFDFEFDPSMGFSTAIPKYLIDKDISMHASRASLNRSSSLFKSSSVIGRTIGYEQYDKFISKEGEEGEITPSKINNGSNDPPERPRTKQKGGTLKRVERRRLRKEAELNLQKEKELQAEQSEAEYIFDPSDFDPI